MQSGLLHGTIQWKYPCHAVRLVPLLVGDASGQINHSTTLGQYASTVFGIRTQLVHQFPLLFQPIGKQFRITSRQINQIGFGQGISLQRTEADDFSQSLQLLHVFPIDKVEGCIVCHSYFHVSLLYRSFFLRHERCTTYLQQQIHIHILGYQLCCLFYLNVHPLLSAQGQSQMSGRNFQCLCIRNVSQAYHTGVLTSLLQILIVRGRRHLVEYHTGNPDARRKMGKALNQWCYGISRRTCIDQQDHRNIQ